MSEQCEHGESMGHECFPCQRYVVTLRGWSPQDTGDVASAARQKAESYILEAMRNPPWWACIRSAIKWLRDPAS